MAIRSLTGSIGSLGRQYRVPVVASSTLLDGLISHWTLDESSGERQDSHGSNPLSVSGTVNQVAGKLGNAAQPATSSSYLTCGPSVSGLSSGTFSIFFWMNFNSQPGGIFDLRNSGATTPIFVVTSDEDDVFDFFGISCFLWSGVSAVSAYVDWPSSGWHSFYVEADYTARRVRISMDNGTLVQSSALLSGPTAITTPVIRIGNTPAAHPQPQTLQVPYDSVSLWSRLLTAGERSSLYNSGAGRTYPFN